MSETRDIEARLDRIETSLKDLVPLIIRIDERLNSTLPHLATKAELESKPGKGFLVGAVAVLLAAYAAGLAGLAALPVVARLVQ